MNFRDARDRLKKIAGEGRYRSVAYEVTEDGGKVIQECSLYISCNDSRDGDFLASASTWAGAFKDLERQLNERCIK